jgi:hypothetical protein
MLSLVVVSLTDNLTRATFLIAADAQRSLVFIILQGIDKFLHYADLPVAGVALLNSRIHTEFSVTSPLISEA